MSPPDHFLRIVVADPAAVAKAAEELLKRDGRSWRKLG